MAETTTGIRAVLSRPAAYSFLQALLVGDGRRRFLDEHARPEQGERVLDLGCGPGTLLADMPGVDYVGVDLNRRYIERARARFGAHGRFEHADVRELGFEAESFDLAVAVGLLHHLDDDVVEELAAAVAALVGPGGRFVTLDNAWVQGQPRVARWLIGKDRGRNVRAPEEYRELLEPHFGSVTATVRGDLMRVPYTHVVLECS